MIKPKAIKSNAITPIKITEPFNCETITFETPEDFTRYYRSNQEELDKLSTNKLNRAFKIAGYHIKRPKAVDGEVRELELIKDYYKGASSMKSKDTESNNSLEDINKAFNQLLTRIINIEEYLKENSVSFNPT